MCLDRICLVSGSDLDIIIYMIIKGHIVLYERGNEISAGNHGRLHPNGPHKHGLRHGRGYFGFEETYLCQRRHSHEYGKICRLVPNCDKPGLCDTAF